MKQRLVENVPLAAMILLETANAHQLLRMWTERTSAGQSLWGWSCVWCALALWTWFYREKGLAKAFWCTLFGVFMNSLVIWSVVYFRYLV